MSWLVPGHEGERKRHKAEMGQIGLGWAGRVVGTMAGCEEEGRRLNYTGTDMGAGGR